MSVWNGFLLVALALVSAPARASSEELAAEIARRRAAVRDFFQLREKVAQAEKMRERWAQGRRLERRREAEAVERARREYVRTRPSRDTAADDQRRERLREAVWAEEARVHEARRRVFVSVRDRANRVLEAGPQINGMVEYGLNTKREERMK